MSPVIQQVIRQRQQQLEAEEIGKLSTALQGAVEGANGSYQEAAKSFGEQASSFGFRTPAAQRLLFQGLSALRTKALDEQLDSDAAPGWPSG